MQNLDKFHPAVARWFAKRFQSPTEAQGRAWDSIVAGEHTLVAAPTGSGKTLAAFLASIDSLLRKGLDGTLEDTTYVVYVSPLKALSNDIQLNLQTPLIGIQEELDAMGAGDRVTIRTLVRSGDTPASERARMVRGPPHIVVTTPESLFILLTSESGRNMLRTTRTVILDEIHAIVQDKRGSHLSLSLERLEALVETPLVRIGLSATQRPVEEVARFLVGTRNLGPDGTPRCRIIDTGHVRTLDLAIELPPSPVEAVMSNEVWEELYDRLATLILEHRTTIVFVNTRRMAERAARHLSERLGEDLVTSHHGSLSREQRLKAEQRLKSGELRALVATASLELGIDIGVVDLVCQIGSTRSIATLLQRVGRSGHHVGGRPKGKIFPLTRDELVECAALLDSIRRGELDQLSIPEKPIDILAQQIVAELGASEWSEDGLYELYCGAYPYRNLERREFDETTRMLANGFATRRGRRGAYIHRDAVNGRLRGRRGARLAAVTSGGAIPDTSDYRVILEPGDITIGSINEDFAVESIAGDIFQLGNNSYRIRRVETGSVRVEDAHGEPPSIPFWLGEAPGRTRELSHSVSRIRTQVADIISGKGADAAVAWLEREVGVNKAAAEQIVDYLKETLDSLGAMPAEDMIVAERFFDEGGGTQIVLHSPLGSRINRAWGLAMRKRFCRKFNFELQAAATENSLLFSLGPTHSFPLDSVFRLLSSNTAKEVLIQALLDSPMFTVRWRWNTTRALAVLRWRSGRKTPPQLQRMAAEDLLALIFPDQLACAENIVGDIEIPDHPLVRQTVEDCLAEAMDVEGMLALLRSIESGETKLIARDLPQPSPLAHEVLTARPYSFLDDAPLEERRAQAVRSRRMQTPDSADDIGKLDKEAIERVRQEAWPEPRTADELHDALQIGFLTAEEGTLMDDDGTLFRQLIEEHRAGVMHHGNVQFWIAAEKLPQLSAVYPTAAVEPPVEPPAEFAAESWSSEAALVELLRGRLEHTGPQTVGDLARIFALPASVINEALYRLEGEGFVLQGRFNPDATDVEWCARHLLARIHQYTLGRLRREIEPVSSADFMRFLFEWQRVQVEDKGEGPDSLLAIIEQLEGFEAAAVAWESDILPARIADYDPAWLDLLCQAGKVIWARMMPPKQLPDRPGIGTVRHTPLTFLKRDNLPSWGAYLERPPLDEPRAGTNTQTVVEYMRTHGASFFADIARGSGLLPAMVHESLGELVASGTVTSDSFIGVRTLLMRNVSGREEARRRKRASLFFGMDNAGRWSLVHSPLAIEYEGPSADELMARKLLARYGIVFRKMLEREGAAPPWRELLRIYRRLEARGDIRGGRFVTGFSGEQFALPEAVARMRAVRKEVPGGKLTSLSAADPLNLVGITTPGQRVSSHAGNRILYRDGIPIAVLESKQVSFLVEMPPHEAWQMRAALVRQQIPPQLRPYLRANETLPTTAKEVAKAG